MNQNKGQNHFYGQTKTRAQAYIKGALTLVLTLITFLGLALTTSGCAVKAIHKVPQSLEVNLEPVKAVIENGDWVVIRGITGPDNFIGTVTNMPFSHASVYDQEFDDVIEANSKGVHRTPLRDYIGSATRVWILKPVWATPETRPLAVREARKMIGRPYDYTGLIGLNLSDSYYCSELAMAVWKPFMGDAEVNHIPLVISPGRLHHWGRVVYDSMEIGLGQVPREK
ncbi:MAG: hypothetical protein LBE80_02790 [Deltaproteobacteria bacterium]|jgi:hypothetical protein|nr:hypothetical protein [Deltaproteobacteria bacterium]